MRFIENKYVFWSMIICKSVDFGHNVCASLIIYPFITHFLHTILTERLIGCVILARMKPNLEPDSRREVWGF